jgi:hypothetical protein
LAKESTLTCGWNETLFRYLYTIYICACISKYHVYIYMYNYMYNYIVIVWRFADAFPRFVYESMCMMYTLLKNKDDESLFIQRAAWHRLN